MFFYYYFFSMDIPENQEEDEDDVEAETYLQDLLEGWKKIAEKAKEFSLSTIMTIYLCKTVSLPLFILVFVYLIFINIY